MLQQHIGIWLWHGPQAGEKYTDFPLLVGLSALGGGAAPLFVTLAGVGSGLLTARGGAGRDALLVRRGLVLWSFGVVLNFLSPSWFSWGSWYVLHMMGFALAGTPLWRRLSDGQLLLACGFVFAGTLAAQTALDTPVPLTNERMRDLTLPGGPLRLALAEGQFPILPWLAFFLAGVVGGRKLARNDPAAVAQMGAGFMAFGALGHLLYRLSAVPLPADIAASAFALRLSFYPCTLAMASLLLGGALLLVALAAWIDARVSVAETHPLVTLGRASLTILMFHVPVFRDLSRLEAIDLWRNVSAGTALAVIAGFIALAAVASRLWHRIDYRYGAEWALRRLAG